MNNQSRRYVFIAFNDLLHVKFKKLEKICTKIFIFITLDKEYVPLRLVRQMQRMGKAIKWISVENTEEGVHYHLSFLMGKLHEKASRDIEFAVLSNDETYDPLIDFINLSGRSCLRVKIEEKEMRTEELVEEESEMPMEEEKVLTEASYSSFKVLEIGSKNANLAVEHLKEKREIEENPNFIEKTAEETIKRLIRSGNRPSELSMLKSYILLHHQGESTQNNIDRIIKHMEDINDIKIKAEEVIYNF